MRGLPSIGEGILRAEWDCYVDGRQATFAYWVFVPGLELYAVSELEDLAGALILVTLPLVTSLSHTGTTVTACRLSRFGASPVTIVRSPAPNAGAWAGGQVSFATLTIALQGLDHGRGKDSILHIPGFPDAFTDDHSRLNQLAWGNASDSAVTWFAGVNGTPTITGGRCVLGTVRRVISGRPAGSATFDPTQAVTPGVAVGCLRRRRGSARALSPS